MRHDNLAEDNNYGFLKLACILFDQLQVLTPIRSGQFQTTNNPPPPYDLENYCVNLHHIHVHFTRCFRHVPIGFFSKIRDFDHFTAISKYKVAKIVLKIIFLLFCLK